MWAVPVTKLSPTELNKGLVRRYVQEVWNDGKLEVADEVLSANYLEHTSSPDESKPEEPHGPGAMKEFVTMFRNAFPDMSFSIQHILAEEDMVAIQLLGKGTHLGELRGLPPTGKTVTFGGSAIHRIQDGKIVETYQIVDRLALREQLGAPEMGDWDTEEGQ